MSFTTSNKHYKLKNLVIIWILDIDHKIESLQWHIFCHWYFLASILKKIICIMVFNLINFCHVLQQIHPSINYKCNRLKKKFTRVNSLCYLFFLFISYLSPLFFFVIIICHHLIWTFKLLFNSTQKGGRNFQRSLWSHIPITITFIFRSFRRTPLPLYFFFSFYVH